MSGCPPFKIKVMDDLNDVLNNVRQRAYAEGVNFTGDIHSGNFSGKGISGHYSVSGNIVTIKITKLGFPASLIYSCSKIEEKLKDYFQNP